MLMTTAFQRPIQKHSIQKQLADHDDENDEIADELRAGWPRHHRFQYEVML